MTLRKTTLAAACVALIGCGAAPTSTSEAFSDSQREDIEEIVREYLIENPRILEEMIAALESGRQAEAAEQARDGIEEHSEALFSPDLAYVAGNPDGDVTVVEFFDYRCGYCRGAVADLQELLKDDPDVKLVLKDYPVLGPASLFASQASIAAGKQGKYVEFHWALMEMDEAISEESVMAAAERLGLDLNQLREDMESDEVAEKLGENIELAAALGINGTPNFVIGDQVIPGAIPLRRMKDLVEETREKNDG
ncbi:MAG: DsbA family protein [Alphaproteobacteria bacterium]